MYAVIEQGGKQYKVAEGDKLEIELTDVAPEATKIELNKVLFIGGDGNNRDRQALHRRGQGHRLVPLAGSGGRQGQEALRHQLSLPQELQRKIGHRQKYLLVTIAKIEGIRSPCRNGRSGSEVELAAVFILQDQRFGRL